MVIWGQWCERGRNNIELSLNLSYFKLKKNCQNITFSECVAADTYLKFLGILCDEENNKIITDKDPDK